MQTFKPNFVIGNPPYIRKQRGKNRTTYIQVFPKFVKIAKKLSNHYTSLIIPNRWFTGGSVSKFRKEMLNDKHLVSMDVWNNSSDLFPNTEIRGGVSYCFWDKNKDNNKKIKVTNWFKNHIQNSKVRPLKVAGKNIFISDSEAINILSKLSKDIKKDNLTKHTSSRRAYGVRSSFVNNKKYYKKTRQSKSDFYCYGKRQDNGYVSRKYILHQIHIQPAEHKFIQSIPCWKVFIVGANNLGIGGSNHINSYIARPNDIATETYVVAGYDLHMNKFEATALYKYIHTDFIKYLIGICKSSQIASKNVYSLVPMQDFSNNSDINWNKGVTDINKQLYKKYRISKTEQKHIFNTLESSLIYQNK